VHQRQRGARHQVRGHRRGQEQEHRDQQFARVQAGAVDRPVQHRGGEDAAHAQGAGLGRAMDAMEEARQLDQGEAAQEHEEAARHQQQQRRDVDRQPHSTMSLRMTYLLSTTVPKNPSMAMIRAISKYTSVSSSMPSSTTSAMVAT